MASGPHRSVLIEADGGSRGNPGAAAYGAVLFDADTREVIAERAECIGTATNNVAEYRGLIAGLELYLEHAPEADLEVRMDSKLVVEQMSGRWKIKHPDMRPLASRAQALAPFGTTYTWIPREQNKHADRILNVALDAQAGRTPPAGTVAPAEPRVHDEPIRIEPVAPPAATEPSTTTTTLVLVRHGVTTHTRARRFSSGLTGSDPALTDEGRAQVRATADWLSPLADGIDVLVTSPARRTRESAEILGARLGRAPVAEAGLAEMDFGSWDGLTYAEVAQRHPGQLRAWLGSLDLPAGGGESIQALDRRVRATLERLLDEHTGRTLLVVSHLTPIKVLVARALGAPLDAAHRMELAPASVTVLSFLDEGRSSMRLFNGSPAEDGAFAAR